MRRTHTFTRPDNNSESSFRSILCAGCVSLLLFPLRGSKHYSTLYIYTRRPRLLHRGVRKLNRPYILCVRCVRELSYHIKCSTAIYNKKPRRLIETFLSKTPKTSSLRVVTNIFCLFCAGSKAYCDG